VIGDVPTQLWAGRQQPQRRPATAPGGIRKGFSMDRGYFGVAVWQPKTPANFGGILRNAHAFGAAFVTLIGERYQKAATDTPHAARHLPLYKYDTLDEFLANRPHDCEIVRVEVDGAKTLPEFTHLERAIYLFGGEDKTLPKTVGERGVRVDSGCLNLATATGVVLYDRHAKGVRRG
jgi:tRNA(Leu) C34 or U34 (ribose-2'-O)-methylase TrmL